jgi:hypothetical protein
MPKKPTDLIFISFSKKFTSEVASRIEKTLNIIYPEKSVTAYLSSTAVGAGNFQTQIDDAMGKAKFAISILSPENKINSPWLMYEAGALSLAARQNGGDLLPYLFCRHIREIEDPLRQLQVKQYQRSDSGNKKQFIDIFIEINKKLSQENQKKEIDIEDIITLRWDGINKELNDIATKIVNGAQVSEGEDMSTASNENGAMDLGGMASNEQEIIRLTDDFSPTTPLEIEDHFEKMLKTFKIPKHWQKKNATDREYNATRVIVNNTRFSTYVVFTDGKRIVLFDRPAADPKNTNVLNERYDVFGSVQFENRTIKKKINNKKFLNAKIQKIEEINGAAIEDNRSKVGYEVETAVMFGICVYLKPEDLDHAKNEAIVIYPINKAITKLQATQLTSKAQLSLEHLIKNLASK